VTKTRAQVLGGVAAVLIVGGYVLAKQLAPRPCSGAVFVEFRPPLVAPGPYRFTLTLDGGAKRCEFEVPLPNPGAVSPACRMRLELAMAGEGSEAAITGLTVGASPRHLDLQVHRGGELVYDARLDPTYTNYPVTREESQRLCGARARVLPACVRGSSACLPFRPACDGPEDCPKGRVCCINADLGRQYGARSAAECSTSARCVERFGLVACHGSEDCRSQATCERSPFGSDFVPTVMTCRAGASTGGTKPADGGP
jgi:hypothetical protein